MRLPPTRYAGTVDRLGSVDVSAVAAWLTAIPLAAWPQQSRLADGQIRPAMVNDLTWQGFGSATAALVSALAAFVDGGRAGQQLLSVVMPGQGIPPHRDRQGPDWWARLHVPLTTDPASAFVVEGVAHHLEPGWVYAVNTEVEHSVTNAAGLVPRMHLMVDWGGW